MVRREATLHKAGRRYKAKQKCGRGDENLEGKFFYLKSENSDTLYLLDVISDLPAGSILGECELPD